MMYFTLGSRKSYEFGIWITSPFVSPVRDREYISIPGRSGDLIFDNERFENVEVKYPCYIKSNFRKNYNALKESVFSVTDYVKLTDTYDTDSFRMVVPEKITEPEINGDSGAFEIVFNSKPQRFLNTGTNTVTLTGNGSIINPTLFSSKPLLRVYGTGILTVGSRTVEILKCNSFTDIDCDLEECFKGTVSCNGNVKVTDFPVFPSGNTGITLGTGITKVIITPKWFVV